MTNKALFLDRDGVINIDHAYVCRVEEFQFIDGIFELCQHAKQLGYKLVVVTNQSGIGRGYYSEEDFSELTNWMKQQFAANSCEIDGVYYCPYHPKDALPHYLRDSDWRKPAPGMLLQAIKDFDLDPSRSIMIGDRETDMQAAEAAEIGRKILLTTGSVEVDQHSSCADEIWPSLSVGLKSL